MLFATLRYCSLVFASLSVFRLLSVWFDFGVFGLIYVIIDAYKAVFYPAFEFIENFFNFEITNFLRDSIICYFIFGISFRILYYESMFYTALHGEFFEPRGVRLRRKVFRLAYSFYIGLLWPLFVIDLFNRPYIVAYVTGPGYTQASRSKLKPPRSMVVTEQCRVPTMDKYYEPIEDQRLILLKYILFIFAGVLFFVALNAIYAPQR